MKELAPLINQAVDLIKGSKEFTLSQAPDFIRQFIVYSYIARLGWLVLSSICLIVVITLSLYLAKQLKKDDVSWLVLLAVGVPLPLAGIFFHLQEMALIHFAPKVYIVTHLAACLGGK